MFLTKILQSKRMELEQAKAKLSLEKLARQVATRAVRQSRPFKSCLAGPGIKLIAELKQASPSKGLLAPDFNAETWARSFEQAGATALSVLTDGPFFQGSLQNLARAREVTSRVPLLRKDFIIDPYQLFEAKLYGADAVLLIVAALDQTSLTRLFRQAQELELTPLVEVHDLVELARALQAGAEVIGINNRNLQSFVVDLETTYQLMDQVPAGVTVVAESGIEQREQLLQLEQAGVSAVLIGEAIVTAADPEQKIRELLGVAG